MYDMKLLFDTKYGLFNSVTIKHEGAYVTSDGSVRYPTEEDKLAEAKRYKEERERRKLYREEYPFHDLIIRVIEVYDSNVDYPDINDALESGTDINCLDANSDTPLDILLKYSADNYANTYDLIEYFLERGAKLGKVVVKENMEAGLKELGLQTIEIKEVTEQNHTEDNLEMVKGK